MSLRIKSDKNLRLARDLCKRTGEYFSAGVNRAYYAVYQRAKLFRLKQERMDAKKIGHKEIINDMVRYAKKNLEPADLPVMNKFSVLKKLREKSDYESTVISKNELHDACLQAERLVSLIEDKCLKAIENRENQ